MSEDKDGKKITLRVDDELLAKIEKCMAAKGKTNRSDFVRDAVESFIENQELIELGGTAISVVQQKLEETQAALAEAREENAKLETRIEVKEEQVSSLIASLANATETNRNLSR